eukprot:NODE_826_length_2744_cov_12.836072.p1 GENE.NODE_826_length_2744_cov_12.836072~~NODE_826_length_2744_cov_12.836072.p1  ORF type:complete len:824 (-),score=270.32 NODE_826_length_2744_cov_12.836072:271-2373(-)
MCFIPAHLMRSVGGEFDNEAVAMAVIVCTFWLWLRSIRTPSSWPFGVLTGISYGYMVATWGGYIFVLNMIGIHACILVGLGRFNAGVHKAYSLFFVIGTYLATQIPVVGMQPLRSLEQLGPLVAFLAFQVLAFADAQRRKRQMSTRQFVVFRIQVFALCFAAVAVVVVMLWPTGYFGPFSSRIRGLFVKHTKTGNPLVDSVAEHQPASSREYSTYLNLPLDYVLYGGLVCLANRTNGCYFMALYGFIAEHFSGKMSRLVLICAPIVSVAAGVWAGFVLDFILQPFFLLLGRKGHVVPEGIVALVYKEAQHAEKATEAAGKGKDSGSHKKAKDDKGKEKLKEKEKAKSKKAKKRPTTQKVEFAEWENEERPGGMAAIWRACKAMIHDNIPEEWQVMYHTARAKADCTFTVLGLRVFVSIVLILYLRFVFFGVLVPPFLQHSDMIAQHLANPTIMYKVNTKTGSYLIDDYIRGYEWIDRNTPKDSRVMAWWDYGYQITGIAKRTSIADGNTWNHEHIALLGRTLTRPQKNAWQTIRHLSDYVLVWAGGQGDDLGKSPHLARIGNSVFPDHCGDDDPRCNKFSFYGDGKPTPMMAASLLYNLVKHNLEPGTKANAKYFKEVHTTKHGLMRVYEVMNVSQESKEWIKNNRLCDGGGWYCPGQYPPALDKLIAKRYSFSQLEDFNKQGAKSAYSKLIEAEQKREL